ncbi:MAG: hypothetical protein HON81_01565 [Verrucomicrobia bacterium]|nr:hypothetical protein [Verrucomicrobiota bacterium]
MDPLKQALLQLGSPTGLALVLLGTTLGVFVGAIPGLTGTMLIALMLPLTFGVDPQYAMTILISIYVGAISGGMINPLSPPSDPVQRRLQSPPAKNKFLAVALVRAVRSQAIARGFQFEENRTAQVTK